MIDPQNEIPCPLCHEDGVDDDGNECALCEGTGTSNSDDLGYQEWAKDYYFDPYI